MADFHGAGNMRGRGNPLANKKIVLSVLPSLRHFALRHDKFKRGSQAPQGAPARSGSQGRECNAGLGLSLVRLIK